MVTGTKDFTPIELNRLHPVIGTEVRGFSIADRGGFDRIDEIKRAWLEHPVLVFRDQRPHRHNGVAITLSIQGEGVYSMIEGQRVDWIEYGAQVTPPAHLYSHHNRGNQRVKSLIFQDEALHYYTRTSGFSWS